MIADSEWTRRVKKINKFMEYLRWRGFFLGKKIRARSRLMHELPLRAEIFSSAQMEEYGRVLAAKHKVSMQRRPDQLLARLAGNEKIIGDSCILIAHALESKLQITPAAEWLLDNYYLIEEQIRTAKKHLPKNYSQGLPRLQQGRTVGPPRIYEIAMEVIAHGDGRIDLEGLSRFITAYQHIAPLQLGELWALPIMLRLALIENLRRIADRIASNRLSRNVADLWADQMIETAEKDPPSLVLVVADMARSMPRMESGFVAELARRLQGQGSGLALPLTWIEQRLAQTFQTAEQLIQTEIQQQAADQVSVSNSIGSLRLLSNINWRDFVEDISVVEQILRRDPLDVYARMDFASRDRYRHRIEEIALQSALSEEEVADHALTMAMQADAGTERTRHIGYYLVDKGLRRLQIDARARFSWNKKIRNAAARRPLQVYLGAILLITIAVAWPLAARTYHHGVKAGFLAFVILLIVLGASQLGVALTNWLATMLARPHLLPRLDFSKAIPDDAKTLVTIPTLLTSPAAIDHLCEALEVRYLANRAANIYFSLLTDFTDASTETLPNDAALVDHVTQGINALNQKYAAPGQDVFFLLHRPRRWNAQEKIWMGEERKRGKLGDLNVFLLTGERAAFSVTAGDVRQLRDIRYVITLDTDTALPRDAARKFIAAMAHPLNQPLYNGALGRVTDGYGILQPRVSSSLPGKQTSYYARLCGGEPGIDPYTRAVSDVYQDVFGEGSFVGKGIYDVKAFETALAHRLPENRILSHDLLEGCYARWLALRCATL